MEFVNQERGHLSQGDWEHREKQALPEARMMGGGAAPGGWGWRCSSRSGAGKSTWLQVW